MSLLDFDTLSFDCYGTLIDWEAGILRALRPWAGAGLSDDRILETFGRLEAETEAERPELPYPQILAAVHGRLGEAWGLESTPEAAAAFGASVPDWPAFDDSPAALEVLARHYRLVILSNVDRRSFRASERRLGVRFDEVYTAEDIGSYKPDPANFEYLLEHLAAAHGTVAGKILHTAQSLYHDHLPAARFGLARCWIDRRHDRGGWGATQEPPSEVEVDYHFTSLEALAAAVEAEAGR